VVNWFSTIVESFSSFTALRKFALSIQIQIEILLRKNDSRGNPGGYLPMTSASDLWGIYDFVKVLITDRIARTISYSPSILSWFILDLSRPSRLSELSLSLQLWIEWRFRLPKILHPRFEMLTIVSVFGWFWWSAHRHLSLSKSLRFRLPTGIYQNHFSHRWFSYSPKAIYFSTQCGLTPGWKKPFFWLLRWVSSGKLRSCLYSVFLGRLQSIGNSAIPKND